MATCKNPRCPKTLVGNEKFFCKSCKDKFKDNAVKGAKATGALIVTTYGAAVGLAKLARTPEGAKIIGNVVKKIPIRKL